MQAIELTILMPCLNEAETIEICIRKAFRFLESQNIQGEILIADNGSTDGSQEIVKNCGARIINVKNKGYGNALIGGINEAKGRYIIMGDADDSYDFLHLELFVKKLREGADLVMGNRFAGCISKGAMPFLHKYLGNPVLSFLGRMFFKCKIRDFHCGLRGFNTEKIRELNLNTSGMEFASEMIVKSVLNNYKITEVPTTLQPDGRSRPPHLKTWRDGWRHLVFLLIYSPNWLFLLPALFLLFVCLFGFGVLQFKMVYFYNIGIDIHTLTFLGFGLVLSYQLILFWLLGKIYSINQGLIPIKGGFLKIFIYFTLERAILFSIILVIIGLFFLLKLFMLWHGLGFGSITDLSLSFRLLVPGAVFLSLGLQTLFSGFLFRVLGIIQNFNYIKK